MSQPSRCQKDHPSVIQKTMKPRKNTPFILSCRVIIVKLIMIILIGLNIFIPAYSAELNSNNTYDNHDKTSYKPDQNARTETEIAHYAQAGASALVSSKPDKFAEQMVRSSLTQQTSSLLTDWLNHFGKARVNLNFSEGMLVKESSVGLLIPLYDSKNNLLFTQLHTQNNDNRYTVNIGAGLRTFLDEWMLGINTFYDHDITGHNQRIGIGLETWRDFLKLSANSYHRITDWHTSRDFPDYHERPANGFDLRAEAYLPAFPQLGGKLIYEQYRGNDVALFNKDQRQKDPKAVTVGLNYTPFPLLTVGVDHRRGKAHQNDTRLNLQFNFLFDVPWRTQINSSAVELRRRLAGNRQDLVDRNYNIVLDYERQNLLRLSLPRRVVGTETHTVNVSAQVATKHPLKKIEWRSPALIAAGGTIIPVPPIDVKIVLPPLPARTAANQTFPLNAVAYDTHGNSSNQATTLINVLEQEVSVTYSEARATPSTLTADGTSQSTITFVLKDTAKFPITGLAATLSLDTRFVATAGLASQASAKDIQLGNLKESAPGEYSATLTSGTQPGKVTVTAMLRGAPLVKTTVDLTPGMVDTALSTFEAKPKTIKADGLSTSSLRLTARDANSNLLSGLTVTFLVKGVDNYLLSPVSDEGGGIYTATMVGKSVGTAEVIPQVNDNPLVSLHTTLTLTPGDFAAARSSLKITPSTLEADGKTPATLTFTARDDNNNPISDLTVTFSVAGVQQTTVSSVRYQGDGVYTATLTGTIAGTAEVTPRVNGRPISTLRQSLTLTQGEFSPAHSSLKITPSTLAADGKTPATLTFTALDANNNPIPDLTVSFDVAGVPQTSVSTIRYQGAGVYVATLTGTSAGTAEITPRVNGKLISPLRQNLTLKQGDLAAARSSLKITPTTLEADGKTPATLTFSARDANNNPIPELTVTFDVTGVPQTTVSTVRYQGAGVYTATLTGTLAGAAEVTPRVNNKQLDTLKQSLTLQNTVTIAIETLSSGAVADNTESNTVKVTVRKKDIAQPGVQVQMSTTAAGVTFDNATPLTQSDGSVIVKVKKNNAGGKVSIVAHIEQTPAIKADTEVTFLTLKGVYGLIAPQEHSFSASSGFPTTGFAGATFTVNATGTPSENTTFIWSTSEASQTSVTNKGEVTLTSNVKNKPVTITARSKSDVYRYTFTVKSWFIQHPGMVRWRTAQDTCLSEGLYFPQKDELTSGQDKRAIGSLWGEWARSTGWSFREYYWTPTTYHVTVKYTVSLSNGAVSRLDADGAYIMNYTCVDR